MLVLWLKLALFVFIALSIRSIDLPITVRLGLAFACVVQFVSLYAQADRIRREDSSVIQIYRLNREQSKFLKRSCRRST